MVSPPTTSGPASGRIGQHDFAGSTSWIVPNAAYIIPCDEPDEEELVGIVPAERPPQHFGLAEQEPVELPTRRAVWLLPALLALLTLATLSGIFVSSV